MLSVWVLNPLSKSRELNGLLVSLLEIILSYLFLFGIMGLIRAVGLGLME